MKPTPFTGQQSRAVAGDRKKQLLLHIGAPKTGSTSLQRVLFNNRATLASHGILYPDLFLNAPKQDRLRFPHDSHGALILAFATGNNVRKETTDFRKRGVVDAKSRQRWATRRIQTLEAQLLKSQAQTCVLSCENFFGFITNSAFVPFRDFLDRHFEHVHLVLYFRPAHEEYASMIQQELKGGRFLNRLELPQDFQQRAIPTHEGFAPTQEAGNQPEIRTTQVAAQRFIQAYSESFGKTNLSIIPYRRDTLIQGDVTQDFCKRFLPPACVSAIAFDTTRANVSIPLAAALTRCVLKQISQQIQQRNGFRLSFENQVIDELVAKLMTVSPTPDLPKLVTPTPWKQLIAHRHREFYEWLEDTFFEGDRGAIVDPSLFETPCPSDVSVEEFEAWLAGHCTLTGLTELLNGVLNLGIPRDRVEAVFQPTFTLRALTDLLDDHMPKYLARQSRIGFWLNRAIARFSRSLG